MATRPATRRPSNLALNLRNVAAIGVPLWVLFAVSAFIVVLERAGW